MDSRTAMQLSVRLNKIGEQLRDKNYTYDQEIILLAVDNLEKLVQYCKQKRGSEPFNEEAFNC